MPEAKAILKRYHWPGNVRELANTIEKCLIFSRGRPVSAEEVSYLVSGKETVPLGMPENFDGIIKRWVRNNMSSGKSNLLNDITDHVTRLIIGETLTACDGNRSQAAKRLGVSRPTLLYKLSKFGLDMPSHEETDK